MPFRLAMAGTAGISADAVIIASPVRHDAGSETLSEAETDGAAGGFGFAGAAVIHASLPECGGQDPALCEELLKRAFAESLERAFENGCSSVALAPAPAMGSGYQQEAVPAAWRAAALEFLSGHEMDIILAVRDRDSVAPDARLLREVEGFIGAHSLPAPSSCPEKRPGGVLERHGEASVRSRSRQASLSDETAAYASEADIDHVLSNLDETFSRALLRIIDMKGKSDVEVYKRANLDRKLFSKIRTSKGYTPGKRTAVALALALELDLEETGDLLRRAGYALSRSQKSDVIVEYFISRRRYDIFEINEVLFRYELPILGA